MEAVEQQPPRRQATPAVPVDGNDESDNIPF